MKPLASRERRIAILAAVAVIGLMLDRVVLTPMLTARDELIQQREVLATQLAAAHDLVRQGRKDRRRMRDYAQAGLGGSIAASESALLASLRKWAGDAGLSLVSIRPDRAQGEHGLGEVALFAGIEGGAGAVARFLYALETAAMPVRVHELQIAARPDNPQRLTVQLRLSTLWDQEDAAAPQAMAGTSVGAQEAIDE